jgi:DNA-binding beta-propeller fold protein YncE
MKAIFATAVLPTLAAVIFLASCSTAPTSGTAPAASQPPARDSASLVLTTRIPLPGVMGRIDHFTVDLKRRLVIFSGLGNNTVEIVNSFENKLVHTITGLDEPQGSLYVPEFDKLFVANAGNGTVKVYDGKTWTLRKSISLGEESDTDNVRYDEATKRVFVGIVGGVAMIDAATDAHVGDLKGSGGHTESFQLEKNGSRVFANVPNDNSTVNVIDRKTGELTNWQLNGAKLNFTMVLDEADHRLFVITRAPPLVIVLNTDTGKEVARVRVKASSDDAYFDTTLKRIYVICGEGYLSVIQQSDPDHYALLENIPTVAGARTGGVSGTNLFVGIPAGATGATEPAQLWAFGALE